MYGRVTMYGGPLMYLDESECMDVRGVGRLQCMEGTQYVEWPQCIDKSECIQV